MVFGLPQRVLFYHPIHLDIIVFICENLVNLKQRLSHDSDLCCYTYKKKTSIQEKFAQKSNIFLNMAVILKISHFPTMYLNYLVFKGKFTKITKNHMHTIKTKLRKSHSLKIIWINWYNLTPTTYKGLLKK